LKAKENGKVESTTIYSICRKHQKTIKGRKK
jgi:hypothetical protein